VVDSGSAAAEKLRIASKHRVVRFSIVGL